MLKNYIKVALRNLLGNRGYSFLNIFGLSAGMACAILILLYVQNETTYDRHHLNHERIYRVGSLFHMNSKTDELALSSPFLGETLAKDYPEIENFCRLRSLPNLKVQSGAATGYEENLLLADPSVLEMFSHRMIYGDPDTCLNNPYNIVLSESVSLKYFGETNPIGDTLTTSNRFKYVVTGVFADLPDNTHHRYEGLLSYSTLPVYIESLKENDYKLGLWFLRDYTFIQFPENYDLQVFYQKFPAFYQKHMAAIGEEIGGEFRPILEPLADVHMDPHLGYDQFSSGSKSYIYVFTIIGIFILFLAVINYVNMATARSSSRQHEVGLRKVLGSRRRDLVFQFLGESMILSFIALTLAFCMVEMVLYLTPFNVLMDKKLEIDLVNNAGLLLGSLGMAFGLGLLAGTYPAFILSAVSPAQALRKRSSPGGSLFLRKGLVVFQFTISIGVIVATSLMQNQIDYIRTLDLGFMTENICVLPVRDSVTQENLPQLRSRLETHEGVIATTTATGVPAHSVRRMAFRVQNDEKVNDQVVDFIVVGYDYLSGMGLQLVEGRDINHEFPEDSTGALLINETAALELFGENPLGKRMAWGVDFGELERSEGQVIGVVKDFKVASLHEKLKPLVLIPRNVGRGMLHIRMKGELLTETMAFVEEVWKESEAAGSPFNPFFIDEKFDKLYEADRRQSSLMGILAAICVIVSILGLLGFSSYTLEQRRREIGIRKVLGASGGRIVRMLMWEVSLLVMMASALAAALGFLGIQWWLREFAYRAEIPWVTFVYSAAIALALAIATVAFQSIRAAIENPVLALKYE